MHGVALRFVSAGNTGIGKAVHSKGVSILSAIIIHMLFKSWVGVIFLCFFKKSLLFYVHQGCFYLIENTVIYIYIYIYNNVVKYNFEFKIAVFYLNIF